MPANKSVSEPKVNNLIFYMNNKKLFQTSYRNISGIILKILGILSVLLILTQISRDYYNTHKEKVRLEKEIKVIQIELESIAERKKALNEYRVQINNLLGYEVYKKYKANELGK